MRSSRAVAGLAAIGLPFLWAGNVAFADDAEIEHLLTAVGQSNCLFMRNGTAHASTEAESHLRMKYRKGARYVDSAEAFIDRIASRSSWSGREYSVACPGTEPVSSSAWLNRALAAYRSESGA